MKTIGINGNEANVPHRVGVGQYAYELIKHLSLLDAPDLRFTVYLAGEPMADMPEPSDRWEYRIFGPQRLWTLTGLQGRILAEKFEGEAPDVFFTPSHYAPLVLPMPSVVSVMDSSYEAYPQFFKKKDLYQLRYWTKISVMAAKKILTISEFSKEEILRHYHLKPENVVVTYPGYDRERFNGGVKNQRSRIRETGKKYKIAGDYLLYLGTLQPKKNIRRLVEAFFNLESKNLKLIIAGMINEGRGGWMYQEIFDKVKELNLENRVIFTGYVPDKDVPYLLAGARAYVLPSIYEGFGIPAVEALATGVPTVVSKVASLPEICGEAAVYIEEPAKTDSIVAALRQILEMKVAEMEKRTAFGLEWVKRYNWEDTAKTTLKVLQNV